jgi:ribose transport system substrate-binding protein
MPMRIAAFTKNGVNPNYQAFLRGAERTAATAGASLTRHFPAQPDDPTQQIALLRAVAREKPDAILFAPADDAALAGPVAEIAATGIPLIGFVNRMPGPFISFVGADDTAMGRTIAGVLIAALAGSGDVVLIEGPETAPTSRARGQGFRAAPSPAGDSARALPPPAWGGGDGSAAGRASAHRWGDRDQ